MLRGGVVLSQPLSLTTLWALMFLHSSMICGLLWQVKQYKDPLNEALGAAESDEEEHRHKHNKPSFGLGGDGHGMALLKAAAASSASEAFQESPEGEGKKAHKLTKARYVKG